MLVRLSNSGFIEGFETIQGEIPNQLTKRARLVYVGDFESMDGPVSVKEEHLQKICTAYNGKLAKLKRLATGQLSVGNLPPVQLDHNRSARDTVGRLENTDLIIEDWTDEDGKTRKALYGHVRFLGKENVEKVLDGRWSTLSIGANFEDGKLDELSVTPFPAAEKASLLGKHRLARTANHKGYRIYAQVYGKSGGTTDQGTWGYVIEDDSGRTITEQEGGSFSAEAAIEKAKARIDSKRLSTDKDSRLASGGLYKGWSIDVEDEGQWWTAVATFPGKRSPLEIKGRYESKREAVEAAIKAIDSIGKKNLSTDKDSIMKLALYQRLRKYLKLKKKMSDEQIEEKMNKLAEEENEKELRKLAEEAEKDEDDKKMSDDDKKDKDDKKMSDEDDEEKKKKLAEEEEKKKEHDKKMSAAKESITRLGADFRTKRDAAHLAAKSAAIGSRLSAIRASGRITPAEVKKIDIKDLASKSQEAIDAVLKTYEDRQPVILSGQLGSMKAMSLKQIKTAGEKAREISELEAASRKNMSLLSKTVKEPEEKDEPLSFTDRRLAMALESQLPVVDLAAMEKDHDEICKLMDGGKIAEAKERLKSFIRLGSYGLAEPTMHEQSMAQLAALQSDLNELSKKFDEALGLAQSLAAGE